MGSYTHKVKWLAFISACVLISAFASAADSSGCKVVKKYPNGSYLVEIDNMTYLTVTETMEKNLLKMKRDLLDAQKELVLKDSLLLNYNETVAWYDTTITHMRTYIEELESILTGYKGLVQDYKKLKEPCFTFQLGVGATGHENKPAILMGTGIYKFRVWGLLQENNSGAFVGKTFPLF
ncbi:hypothetical protein JXJ21_10760 [candidate division KSB1 bacterium]|nr:hypothetical protein [candidate division KSB1 bacterium]